MRASDMMRVPRRLVNDPVDPLRAMFKPAIDLDARATRKSSIVLKAPFFWRLFGAHVGDIAR